MTLLMLLATARAELDPKCANYQLPSDYDEQTQADFLANYFSLATTYSPVHAPVPHQPGHGSIGLDVAILPPLGCKRRLVLNGTKTEETNKTPVAPRIRASYAFNMLDGKVVPYASMAFLPPVKLLGTTNVIVAGELGVGVPIGEIVQVGARYHFSLGKTVGDIATPFNPGDPVVDDLYVGSSFGFDALFGADLGPVVPYAAVGFTDVSTFFYIGDTGVVTNNLHPFAGLTFSVGADALAWNRVRLGGELYGAPGGSSRPDPTADRIPGFGRYGHIYTGRFRIAVEI